MICRAGSNSLPPAMVRPSPSSSLRREDADDFGLNPTRICSVATSFNFDSRSTNTGIVCATRDVSRRGSALTTVSTGAAPAPLSCSSMNRPNRLAGRADVAAAFGTVRTSARNAVFAMRGPSSCPKRTPMSSGDSSS
ncbi:MAG: hypothetical protein AAB418_09255 [candidate division NC10 bacterium]